MDVRGYRLERVIHVVVVFLGLEFLSCIVENASRVREEGSLPAAGLVRNLATFTSIRTTPPPSCRRLKDLYYFTQRNRQASSSSPRIWY